MNGARPDYPVARPALQLPQARTPRRVYAFPPSAIKGVSFACRPGIVVWVEAVGCGLTPLGSDVPSCRQHCGGRCGRGRHPGPVYEVSERDEGCRWQNN